MDRIGGEVEKALGRTGKGEGLALTEITRVWAEAVGAAVARQAWPLRVARDGTLHVATVSATWAFELDRLSPQIEERLAGLLHGGAPARLRFRVGPVPEPGKSQDDRPERDNPPPPSSPETDAAAASATAGIEDPELRELVARAARASLARARLRPPFLVD